MEYQGIEKLRGAENWSIWKFAMRNMLRGIDGAYEVCVGDITKPTALAADASVAEKGEFKVSWNTWDKADRAASQIIVKTVEARVMALLVTCESARDMWVKLHSVYEQQTKQAAHTVQSEFFSFKMNSNDDMVTHIAKFEGLVLRMQQLNVKPDESSLMVKLLDTLPDDYESLRQAWWARSENQQTFTNLIQVLTSDENRRKQHVEKHEELVALMAAKSSRSHENKRESGGARNEQSRHMKRSVGFTAGNSKEKKPNFKCYGCGGKGHIRRNCPKKQIGQKDFSARNGGDSDQAFISEVMNAEIDNDVWVIDSGATDHITCHKDWFSTFECFVEPVTINVGNKSTMDALGKGRINFEAAVNGKWLQCHMEDVLFVPSARRNLFSVPCAVDKGLKCSTSKTECVFTKDGVVKARGVRVGKLYKMDIRVKQPEMCKEANLVVKDTLQIWHERLGHQNKRHVQNILKQRGIDIAVDNKFCGACVEGKQHRNSFQSRQQRSMEPGEIIHADLCGPMECTSLGGAKYFLCFTCDYSRLRIVYFLKEKSESIEKIAEMLKIVKNHRGRAPKAFQCDGGREFNNSGVQKLMKMNGVKLIVTNPYTPEQNGCAERSNRTVVELARTMLLAKNLPKFLWAEAVNTAVYILNRTGPSNVDGKTPYELFTGKTAHLNKLRVFGTKCFVHVPSQQRRKWDAKGKRGVFVGYSDEVDGYRIWIQPENSVVRSRNVVFEPEIAEQMLSLFPVDVDDGAEVDEAVPDLQEDEKLHLAAGSSTDGLIESPRHLRDRSTIKSPERLIEVMLAEIDEPRSFAEANNSRERLHWKAAMEEEMASLEENSTWTLVELPVGRKPVSNRWVYRVKRKANGEIDRYKARLVVRGFSQREGIDYNETFSPVARFDTIRTVLSIAANEHLKLVQFDVKTAFLNGVIEEEIFMQQPEGYSDGTNRVCKLLKSLYGLKQSPRCWKKRFKDVLLSFGLCESTADPCLFYRATGDEKLIVVLYVDDGLVAAQKKTDIDKFLCKLKSELKITIEPIGHFLNLQIEQADNGSIFVHQKTYSEGVLKKI